MPSTVEVTHPGGTNTPTRAVIQAAVDANPGKIIKLSRGISSTWTLDGRAGDANQDNANALGAVEMGENLLHIDNGTTVVESAATPLVGTRQCAVRWLDRSLVGLILGPGARLTGRRDLHTAVSPDPAYTEWQAGIKAVNSGDPLAWQDFIVGNDEAHITGWKGDGFWLASGTALSGSHGACKKLRVSGVLMSGNWRHGWVVEDCNGFRLANCGGAANDGFGSSAWGIIEPDNTGDSLVDIRVEDCEFEGHAHSFHINLASLNQTSPVVGVTLRNMLSNRPAAGGADPYGLACSLVSYNGSVLAANSPTGVVNIENYESRQIKDAGAYIHWNMRSAVKLNLHNLTINRCAETSNKPIQFDLTQNPIGLGIDLDARIIESLDRIATAVTSPGGNATNVTGHLYIDREGKRQGASQTQALLPNLLVQRYRKQNQGYQRLKGERTALRDRELLPRTDYGRNH